MQREFDVIVWGATGYTGVHAAEYMALQYGPDTGVRWAMAGRSKSKLHELQERLARLAGDWAGNVPILVVDSLDEDKVAETAARAKAVATVVGPFAKYGAPLVKACVENGTHYVDVTGETQWVKSMINQFDKAARENNTFIVPSCGFDSVPSDLGTFMLAKEMQRRGKTIGQVSCMVSNFAPNNRNEGVKDAPTPGSGTMSSLLGAMEQGRDVMLDPYALVDSRQLVKYSAKRDSKHWPQLMAGYDKRRRDKPWTTHFVMAWINEKTVRRSSMLLKDLYGPNFSFGEGMCTANPFMALALSVVFCILYAFLSLPFGPGIARRAIPAPSQTPPERQPSKYKPGSFEFSLVAESDSHQNKLVLHGRVVGRDEGGFAETGKMLMESALALALQKDEVVAASGHSGGLLTPAVLGETLIERLRAKDMVFEVIA